jgi:interferon-induced GTP-binding protein Mx1
MDTYVEAYDESVRPLMNKIDEVRRLLGSSNVDIDFPNVVVVGNPSSGKTTLLEALSLVELPKGNGIVTRCPLVLRLRKSDARKLYRLNDNKERDELDEKNLNISQYIEQKTKKLAGNNKNIVEDLIELEINDPNTRDLTIVDLPGIVHNVVKDQPKNIHDQIIKLIKKYISQPGCVILCICPANVDIATAESIALAHDVDPSGERTIGVITKSDLPPDENMLVEQLLMNRQDIPHLKLGIVAVRNLSFPKRKKRKVEKLSLSFSESM